MTNTPNTYERLLSRCVEQDGCLVWTGGLDRDGYGKTSLTRDGKRSNMHAHRLAWLFAKGYLPAEGRELDHLCRNRACVRIEHLEDVSRRANWERSEAPSNLARLTGKCKRGHDLTDPQNVYVFPSTGKRRCRTCFNAWQNEKRRLRGRTDG